MGTPDSTKGGGGQDEASTTLGVGGTTSGQTGATPARETQAETGGSGGAQLTHSHGDIQTPNEDPAAAAPSAQAGSEPNQPSGSALQSGARGAQDTRPEQGGGTGTGLGTPETGANQSADDLPAG
ncbi:MAG: hypothetical protein V7631_3741 [Massilia sp.]|jgi:hypothetical protein